MYEIKSILSRATSHGAPWLRWHEDRGGETEGSGPTCFFFSQYTKKFASDIFSAPPPQIINGRALNAEMLEKCLMFSYKRHPIHKTRGCKWYTHQRRTGCLRPCNVTHMA